MNKIRQQGFTIVEVLLFVSISGLLIATLTVGWTANLNTQRYRDSVTTLQSFLQQQYNLVYNVENGARGSQPLECDTASGEIKTGAASLRGQTDCVLLGRYITVRSTPQGSELEVFPITGLDPDPAVAPPASDYEAIITAKPHRVDFDIGLSESKLTVPWGAKIVTDSATAGTPAQDMVIAIIRSPLARGTVHTYAKMLSLGQPLPKLVTDGASPGMIDDSGDSPNVAAEPSAKLCLDAGAVFSGVRMAVILQGKASSQSSVETSAEVGC